MKIAGLTIKGAKVFDIDLTQIKQGFAVSFLRAMNQHPAWRNAMDVSRRKFLKSAQAVWPEQQPPPWALPQNGAGSGAQLQIAARERDPQHLHILLRGLRAINV
jgi:hypothetical protein